MSDYERELQWRAFLAGYDQRAREAAGVRVVEEPLDRVFERWLKHEDGDATE